MPRIYIRKTSKGINYTKEQLQEAVTSVSSRILTLKKASDVFKIPKTTIRDHLKGRRGQKSKSCGRSTDIPIEDEKKIAESIKALDKWGFGFSRKELIEKVGEYVRINKLQTRFKDGTPGADWFLNFKRRHNLSIKRPQSVEVSRRNALDPFIISSYFDLLKKTMEEMGIKDTPELIWNLDETSFTTDPSKTKVVGQKGVASTRTTSGPGRENTSVLMACNAVGEKAPALIIFKGKDVYDEWTVPEDDPNNPELVYAATKRGWMENDVFNNYVLKILVNHFGDKRPVLLIYDGHSTHISIELIEKAIEQNIVILKLPPHSSHLLQPLDISVFKSLKTKWDAKLVKWQRAHPGKKIVKKIFSGLVKEIWQETDASIIIQSGFRKAGIFPFNSQIIPKEKYDPLAYQRWENFNREHITAENVVIDNDTQTLEGTTSSITTEPQPSTSRPPLHTLNSNNVSFEELLLATIKSNKDQNLPNKPKRRIAAGAEVITRQEVVNRILEREGKNQTKKKSSKTSKEIESDSEEENEVQTIIDHLNDKSDDELDEIVQFEEETIFEDEISKEYSELKQGDWILVKFEGKKTSNILLEKSNK